MEPEVSLPCSQEDATCPRPETHNLKNSHEIWYFLCELFYTSLS